MSNNSRPLCACGCGQPVTRSKTTGKWNKFILGHNNKKGAYEKTKSKNRPHRFKKGNKHGKGRPQGSRNSASIAIESTFEGEREALTRKCIELALNGNSACLKTAIERLCPVRKSSPIRLKGMPVVDSVTAAGDAAEFILQSIATGNISPLDGEILSRVLDKRLHALQVTDIERELKEIKSRLADS